MTLISGAQIANEIKNCLKDQNQNEKVEPGLAVILVGEQADSTLYVSLKEKATHFIGGRFRLEKLNEEISKEELLKAIDWLNQDIEVDGIVLQLPLPGKLESYRDELLSAISPVKDVDGFHPHNRGLLLGGEPGFVSAAALACREVMHRYIPDLAGRRVNLIGSSFDLIMPLALLLLKEDCQVSLFPDYSFEAVNACDALVIEQGSAAVITRIPAGGPELVIDAGFYLSDNGIVGNVSREVFDEYSGRLLPVPGGLGPILIAKLMENLNRAARRRA